MLARFLPGPDTSEIRQRFIDTIPLARLCTPDDVAAAIVFLASEEAAFITGTALGLDGGRGV